MGTPAASSRWLTWANGLTAIRLAAAPGLAVAICEGAPLAAAALFTIAGLTDVFDGRVARRLGQSSPLGGFLDHATDAIFVTTGLAALATRGEIPPLLPTLVSVAFVQYTVDSRWLSARAPLRASRLGRTNGILYFVPIGIAVWRDALGLAWPGATWLRVFGWLLAATTAVSMADRAVALWRERRGPQAL